MNVNASKFKIFPKKSASPTIMIKTTAQGAPIVLKLWSKSAKVIDENFLYGLAYEQQVYARLIHPYLKQHPTAPFLKYLGEGNSSYRQLADFVGVTTQAEDHYLSVALLQYLYGPQSENYYDEQTLRHIQLSQQLRDELNTVKFLAIMLPYIEFNTLGDYIQHGTSQEVFKLLADVIAGVTIMYTKLDMVHNDLHAGNVLVEKNTNNVLIFDYDRAYANGFPNGMLTDGKCGGTCGFSQCNILTEDGFATDFYKVMSYFAHRNDFMSIVLALTEPARHDTIKRNTKMIQQWFNHSAHSFFSENGCTYLQFPNQMMTYIHSLFGHITDVYDRVGILQQSFRFGFSGSSESTEVDIKPKIRELHKKQTAAKGKRQLSKRGLPPPRSIVKIIQENDLRKYGPGR